MDITFLAILGLLGIFVAWYSFASWMFPRRGPARRSDMSACDGGSGPGNADTTTCDSGDDSGGGGDGGGDGGGGCGGGGGD